MSDISEMLHGGSEHGPKEYVGQTILSAGLEDDRLTLGLSSGKTIQIWDAGQECCEHRYATTDDNVANLIGATLIGVTAELGPNDVHETCFVKVETTKGFVTLTTHNEHNGYYGGFALTITEKD